MQEKFETIVTELIWENKQLQELVLSLEAKVIGLSSINNSLIEEKHSLIEEKHSLIEEKHGLIEEKTSLIEEKHSLIEEKTSLIEEKTSILKEKDHLLEEKHNLVAENQELKDRLKVNSTNSSLPPSKDITRNKNKNRTASDKKPGGQPGHAPHQYEFLVADQVIDLVPKVCKCCGETVKVGSHFSIE